MVTVGRTMRKVTAFIVAAAVCLLQILNGVTVTKGSTTLASTSVVLGNTDQTVSVHDPSIVTETVDGVTTYYIFGSHLAWAKSTDLVNWENFTNNINSNYLELFEKEFAWAANGNSTYEPAGNMWAPDVVYNESIGKWCMYISINGMTWNSSIALLTADTLSGDWTYQGTVIYSGYTSSSYAYDFTQTDFIDVTGESTLPSRYIRSEYTETVQSSPSTVYSSTSTWNKSYGAHAIDPCVLYDEEGNLWMTYGSWSGGIYMIELDKATGFRDASHTYETVTNQSDAYMGVMIAGGGGGTGEASYVQYIDGYYYLFVTYGGFVTTGGYNMRLFRSATIDGSYTDVSGNNAIGSQSTQNTNGLRVMSYYKWSWWDTAQLAQGHNSAMVDADGNKYLVYHTKTDSGNEGHYVRVHQMFVNEDGWLCVSPFTYDGTEKLKTVDSSEVTGTYEVIMQESTDYASLACVENKEITLNADKTVSGSLTGTWTMGANGSPYVTMVLDGVTYKGVFTESTMEESNVKTMAFSLVGASGSDEIAVWGSKYPTDETAVAWVASELTLPSAVYRDISLVTEEKFGTSITWTTSDSTILSRSGTVGNVGTVTLTATIEKGDYYQVIKKDVEVKSASGSSKTLIASYYTDNPQSLAGATEGTYQVANPFNENETAGIDISNGVSIKFDVALTGSYSYLSNILGFTGTSGKLYFTGGSYLGYNATGGYFDANIDSTNWVPGTDFIGDSASVEIELKPSGYSVYIDGEEVYNVAMVTGGTIYGASSIVNYADVLTWLNETATTLNFGWGSWWSEGFDGTISNVECYVLPEEISEKTLVGSYYTDSPQDLTNAAEGTYQVTNPFNQNEIAGLDISNGVSIKFDVALTGSYAYLSNILGFTGTSGKLYFTGGSYLGYNADGGYFDANVDSTNWTTGTDFIGSSATVEIVLTSSGYSVYVNDVEVYNETSLILGTITGNCTVTDYSNVLTWLNETATTLSFGSGSWWSEGFSGTISNVECYVLPEDSYKTLVASYYTDDPMTLTSAAEGTYQVANPFNASQTSLDISNGVSIKFDVKRTGAYAYLSNILGFTDTSGKLYFTGGSYLGYNANGGYFDANVDNTNWSTGTDFISTRATVEIVIKPSGYSVYMNGKEVYNEASVANGTISGSSSITDYGNVLTWLNENATYLNFGWGSWWSESFNGTISNVECYVLSENPSDYEYYQNYSSVSTVSALWTSASAQDGIALVNDGDSYGNYIAFTQPESASGNRGAVSSFGEAVQSLENYTVEVDVALRSGNVSGRSQSQFVLTGTDTAATSSNNSGVSSGYILKLSTPDLTSNANTTTWYINDTSESITIPSAEWVHIKAVVDKAAGTALVTITNGSTVLYTGTVSVNGTGALNGLYVLSGRGNGLTKVDNIKVQ